MIPETTGAALRACLAVACLGLLLGACGAPAPAEAPLLALDGRTMGTGWSVRVAEPPAALDAEALRGRLEGRLARVNALMSTYDPASELSLFNEGPADVWVDVDPELVTLVSAAAELSALTDGAFDVTVAPLVDLWGFGAGAAVGVEAVPDAAAISAALARTGHDRLAFRTAPPSLRKRGALSVDLSAIAKGHGVDELARVLEDAGLERYLVEIGGELRARGLNARGVPWQVGIEVPDPTRKGVARAAIGLADGSVATSGDYRNFFTVDGVRYSHTIDPSTGRPVDHQVASVTVIHPSAMWADGWATALNVLGSERGLEIAERLQLPVSFVLYTEDGLRDVRSSAFADYLARSAP